MKAAILFCFAVCLSAQGPPAPSASNGERGSIAGTVVNSVTQAPVGKAQVELLPINVSGGVGVSSVVTDASGNFSVTDLPPGTYHVTAHHPDYPDRASGIGSVQTAARVDLQPGEQKRDVTIALTPGAAISGRVADSDGDPLTGCGVTVLHPGHQPGRGEAPFAGDQTDDHGQYRIFNIPAGSYYVRVQCGRQPATPHPLMTREAIGQLPEQGYPALFYPASPDFAGATAIKAAAGTERQGIDFQLDRIPVYSVRGNITGLAGDQMNRLQLVLMLKNDPAGDSDAQGARLDPSTGKFVFRGIRRGDYVLSGLAYGNPAYCARLEISVSDSSINGLVVPFRPPMEIRGTIELEGSDSSVKSTPQVTLRPAEPMRVYTYPTDVAAPGATGDFVLKFVVPGRWMVQVNNLPPNAYVKSIRFGDQEVTGGIVDIAQDSAGPLKIVISAKAATIQGNVSGADGPCVVFMVPQNVTGVPPNQLSVMTTPQGNFTLPGLAPGSYRLFALDPSIGNPDPDLLKKIESRGETVSVSEGEKASAQLQFIPPSAIEDRTD